MWAHARLPGQAPARGGWGRRETGARVQTVRGQRLANVQLNVQQAHETVVSAIMEKDKKIEIVKPNYLVRRVVPNKRWPDGGVVVYANFPFLLDDSWAESGAWSAWCRKLVCAPDGQSNGGTCEVLFILEKDQQDGPGANEVSGSSGDDGSQGGDDDYMDLTPGGDDDGGLGALGYGYRGSKAGLDHDGGSVVDEDHLGGGPADGGGADGCGIIDRR